MRPALPGIRSRRGTIGSRIVPAKVRIVSSGSADLVEGLGQFAAHRPGCLQFRGALLELQADVGLLLVEDRDAGLELLDVVGSAEPGLPPDLLAEQFRQLRSNWATRAASRVAWSQALARSALSDARLTAGPTRLRQLARLQRHGSG